MACQDPVGQFVFLKLLPEKNGGSECHYLRDQLTCHLPCDKKQLWLHLGPDLA